MSAYTEHYQLHQWEPEDPFLRMDFNADLQKIDTTLGELAEATAQVGKLGNCEISHTAYTGNGALSRTQTFPGKPMVVMVAKANSGYSFVAWRGMQIALPHYQNGGVLQLSLTWADSSVTWSHESNAEHGLNQSGTQYEVIALLDMNT